tara:strand:+ start:89 stop:325 length:237 start_codon:yes stop_codon:yes gene_type:complete
MKKLTAQALGFQYKLAIENSRDVINHNNKPLAEIDRAITESLIASQKLNFLNEIIKNSMKNIETFTENSETEDESKDT